MNNVSLAFQPLVLAFAFILSATSLGQGFLPPLTAGPTSTEAGVVNEATVILEELSVGMAAQIPGNLLAAAEGVVVVPHYVRGAFVIGIAGGRGVMVSRGANRQWQAPEFITLGGGSFGWQAGIQSTDLVLVLMTPKSVANIRQGNLTLGANASAAAGPVGRYAAAATDFTAQAEIYTYSKTRGLFAGVSLNGAVLKIDIPSTQLYYQTNTGGPGVVPQSAISLVTELNGLSKTTVPTVPAPTTLPAGTPVTSVSAVSSFPASMPVSSIQVPAGGLTPLEVAVSSLLANVDGQWQDYLSLPADWKGATELPADEVYGTLTRYERVATNPEFIALRSLPAFGQALKSLQDLAAQTPNRPELQLPPPPPIVGGNTVPGVR